MGEVLSRVPVRDRLVWWSRLRGVARWIGVAGGLAAVGLYLVSRDWGGETTYVDSNRKYWSVMVDQGWVEVGRWNAGFPYLMSPPDPGFTHRFFRSNPYCRHSWAWHWEEEGSPPTVSGGNTGSSFHCGQSRQLVV